MFVFYDPTSLIKRSKYWEYFVLNILNLKEKHKTKLIYLEKKMQLEVLYYNAKKVNIDYNVISC